MKASRNAGLLIDALEEWPSHKIMTAPPMARPTKMTVPVHTSLCRGSLYVRDQFRVMVGTHPKARGHATRRALAAGLLLRHRCR